MRTLRNPRMGFANGGSPGPESSDDLGRLLNSMRGSNAINFADRLFGSQTPAPATEAIPEDGLRKAFEDAARFRTLTDSGEPEVGPDGQTIQHPSALDALMMRSNSLDDLLSMMERGRSDEDDASASGAASKALSEAGDHVAAGQSAASNALAMASDAASSASQASGRTRSRARSAMQSMNEPSSFSSGTAGGQYSYAAGGAVPDTMEGIAPDRPALSGFRDFNRAMGKSPKEYLYARGGEIGNVQMDRGTDTIDAKVRPGEYLLNPETVQAVGGGSHENGVRNLDQLVRRTTGRQPGPIEMPDADRMKQGFERSGMVDPRTNEQKMADFARASNAQSDYMHDKSPWYTGNFAPDLPKMSQLPDDPSTGDVYLYNAKQFRDRANQFEPLQGKSTMHDVGTGIRNVGNYLGNQMKGAVAFAGAPVADALEEGVNAWRGLMGKPTVMEDYERNVRPITPPVLNRDEYTRIHSNAKRDGSDISLLARGIGPVEIGARTQPSQAAGAASAPAEPTGLRVVSDRGTYYTGGSIPGVPNDPYSQAMAQIQNNLVEHGGHMSKEDYAAAQNMYSNLAHGKAVTDTANIAAAADRYRTDAERERTAVQAAQGWAKMNGMDMSAGAQQDKTSSQRLDDLSKLMGIEKSQAELNRMGFERDNKTREMMDEYLTNAFAGPGETKDPSTLSRARSMLAGVLADRGLNPDTASVDQLRSVIDEAMPNVSAMERFNAREVGQYGDDAQTLSKLPKLARKQAGLLDVWDPRVSWDDYRQNRQIVGVPTKDGLRILGPADQLYRGRQGGTDVNAIQNIPLVR